MLDQIIDLDLERCALRQRIKRDEQSVDARRSTPRKQGIVEMALPHLTDLRRGQAALARSARKWISTEAQISALEQASTLLGELPVGHVKRLEVLRASKAARLSPVPSDDRSNTSMTVIKAPSLADLIRRERVSIPVNVVGAVLFSGPLTGVREQIGMPALPPSFAWMWVLAFGLAFAYMNRTRKLEPTLVAVSAWGELTFVVAMVAAAITGEGSVMCAASSGLDLGLALVFGYGLLVRARSGTVAPNS